MIRRSGFLALVIAISACTPDIGGPSPTELVTTTSVVADSDTTSTTVGGPFGAEAFRTCLAEFGVIIEPIPLDANGRIRLDFVTRDLDFTDPEVAGAVTDCSKILGVGALDLITAGLVRTAVIGQLEDFSRCIRARGVDFPDPIEGFTGVGSPYPVAVIPYSDPALADVVSICLPLVLQDLPGVTEEP